MITSRKYGKGVHDTHEPLDCFHGSKERNPFHKQAWCTES
jgi:hypothetical protein